MVPFTNAKSKSQINPLKMSKKKRRTRDFAAFMIGMVLIIWEIFIYRKTIIQLWILFTIIATVGAWRTWRNYKDYIAFYKREGGNLFVAIMHNTVSWGFTVCSIFMLSNYYLANSKKQIRTFQIEETSSMPGRKYHREKRKPLIRINFDGEIKELVFSSAYFDEIEKYKDVTLVTQKGLFGFDIILEQNLH